jgi:hypothetical protein
MLLADGHVAQNEWLGEVLADADVLLNENGGRSLTG